MYSSAKTLIREFADPLKVGFGSEFDGLALPGFDRLRLSNHNIGTAAEIFPDPLNLKAQLRPLNLLWVGVTGDLLTRFALPSFYNLFEAIPGLNRNLTIHGVASREAESGQTVVNQLRGDNPGLQLADYAVFNDAYLERIRSGELSFDGIFIATLPSQHLEHCERCIQATGGKVQIYCEKPLVVPKDLKGIQDLDAKHQNVIVPIDFFATTTPLYYLLTSNRGKEILAQIGAPRIINGTLVENQLVEHNRLGGNFGLLNIEKAGGGIMLDCGIHSLVMALIFKKNGIASNYAMQDKFTTHLSPQTYLTQSAIKAALGKNTKIKLEELRETGGLLSRMYGADRLVINAIGAKGVDQNMYALDVLTEKGFRLIISVGTDFQPPYLSITSPDGNTEMITFDTPSKEVGYGGAFYDMFGQMLLGQDAEVIPTTKAMFDASSAAIDDLGKVNSIAVPNFVRHKPFKAPHTFWTLPTEIQKEVPHKRSDRR